MSMNRKMIIAVLLLTLIVVTGCSASPVEQVEEGESVLPDKVTLVVPWNPGDMTDTVARTYAAVLEKYLGSNIVVVNQPGASGAIGTAYVAGAPADGSHILFSAETPGTFQVMGISDLGFEDFEPISLILQDIKIIVVAADSEYETIDDLIKDMKENPGKVKMAYSGPGASGHIQGLLLEKMGFDISMTPFGSGVAGITAVLGGQVDFTFSNATAAKGHVEAGDLRVLATFSEERHPAWPEVPSFAEAFPDSKGHLMGFPNCVLVKKGTPDDIINTILEASRKAVQDPIWQEFVENGNFSEMYTIEREDAVKYWEEWTAKASWMLYDAGVAKYSPEKFGIERP